ncbi:MAG: DUF6259 domain-containing protein, partial [Omnitrophica WOR_2 bacterium]
GWQILNRAALGLSFRLLLPLPGRRNNPVHGEKQKLSSLETGDDGDQAVFIWDNLVSEYGGKHDITVKLTVSLTQRQAIYALTVKNNSGYTVENVYCPYLGDIQHPEGAEWFQAFSYNYATAQEWPLWPAYQNLRGYFGVDYPTQFGTASHNSGLPMAPFMLLHSADQGLYIGAYQASPELVVWHTELRPGYGSSIDARVPETAAIAGIDVATRFAAVHLPYILPGETRSLTPLALEAYQGDWQQGVDIYKEWRNRWMKLPSTPAWARDPHAWQQIHINSPEDELRIPFRELSKIGEDCARHGVKAIQLVGWNDGGQDQGNPSHDPDPRLGSFDELRQAIKRIQAMGVKVILFSKFTWADRATDRFRNDLIRLAIKDPYGDYYLHGGYQYQTATQLLDINTRRLIPMCFLSDEYLKVCDEEFTKTLELGADGILFDECLHHSPSLLCFDTRHRHRSGAPVYANDRKLIQNFSRLSNPVNPEFLYSGEACYDWEFEAYHLSYHRSENKQHIPLMRYMQPEALLMTAVTGFDDRNMINQCLMYRYIISYEPYHFKGRLDDFPLTLSYGKKMDELRTELRAYFWDGEFRHEVGAQITCKGKPHHPYSVFINKEAGKSGIVVSNYDDHENIIVQAALDNHQPLNRYRLIDDPAWSSTEQGILIPACSAAVILE